MNSCTKKRTNSIDLIKFIASVFVIGVHYLPSINFLNISLMKKTAFFASIIYTIFLTCVPLFFLCSGYLLSSRKITKTHYLKFTYFIITICIILTVVRLVNFHSTNFLTLIKKLPYYIPYYFIIYLFAPYINLSLNKLSKKQFNFLLFSLILVICIFPTTESIFHITITNFMRFAHPVLFYIMGVYIKNYPIKKYKHRYMYISMFILPFLNTVWKIHTYYRNFQ